MMAVVALNGTFKNHKRRTWNCLNPDMKMQLYPGYSEIGKHYGTCMKLMQAGT